MKCVVLAAGYATRLYPLTENFPKPLLDVNGKSILDWLLDDIDTIEEISEIIIISNHRYFNHFLNWKNDSNLTKPIKILDDGSIDNENRLGAVKDIYFAIEKLKLNEDLLIIAGDNILDFSFSGFVDYFHDKNASCVMRYFEPVNEVLQKCGVVEINDDDLISDMVEKPLKPATNWAVPPFYIYKKSDIPLVEAGIKDGCKVDAPGNFIAWLCKHSSVYAMEMSGKRYDIGDLQSYEQVKNEFSYGGII